MTHPFKTNQLPFFLTAPAPCPYLPGEMERKVFTKMETSDGAALNDALTHVGFRRSQSILYRPACERCAACKSARIPVSEVKLSRSQRRIVKRNRGLIRSSAPAQATPELYALLSRYLDARHGDGDMAGMDFFEFASMVEDGAQSTSIAEYRDADGFLMAAALIDELSDGFSMVYSFFDPDLVRYSLGSFMILDHIERAREAGLDHIYLGYWVPGSPKMHYKAAFQPLEILEPAGWRRLTDAERQVKT
ncbi:putative arginyl-tRNA--protein transferase [Marinicauda pacifica]|uniref:Aspartate/glutamate leucyltransferase n=1 Tax=Marinicauda pacifica TaxID=1133559 RepID=A0A4S2HG20_9PROT|nr:MULTISPECIES: arginyltransferase [Marinicauda]TGY94592.1 arginyltransferase [Marinicauda pacifica]GGE37151.1 putative arginyl-tRNA--protein transferase [Marinicauda pacifica]